MRKLLKPSWRKRWSERQVGFLVWKRHHQGRLDRSYGQRRREKSHRVGVREEQEHELRCLWSLWARIDQWQLWSQWRTVRLWPTGAPRHFSQAGPCGCYGLARVSLLLEAFSSSFTSLRSDTHEFLRDVKEVPIYMQRNASRTKRCRCRQAHDSELGCPVMLRVSSKEVVKIVIAKALSWEKSGLPSLVNRTCVVSSLFSSRHSLKSSKCPLVGEIRHCKAGRGPSMHNYFSSFPAPGPWSCFMEF